MTVQSTVNKITHLVSDIGQTEYIYDFRIDDSSHCIIYLNESLVSSGDYIVNDLGSLTGGTVSISFTTALDDQILILREMPLTQLLDYITYGKFPSATHEKGLDYGIMIDQQLSEQYSRVMRFPVYVDLDPILPIPAFGYVLAWNSAEDAIINRPYVTGDESALIYVDHKLDGSHIVFESIADLRANTLAPFDGQVVKVTGYYAGTENRPWRFKWNSSDLSTEVAADTKSGIYVAPVSDLTGASGAWERLVEDVISVVWFGAGKATECSDEIQAAADYVYTLRQQITLTAGQTAATTLPKLFFPSDIYIINKQINIEYYDHIYGENSIIKQDSSFTGDYAFSANFGGWEFNISGLSFDGFDQHLFIDNNNTDQGVVTFNECKFYGGDKAVHLAAQSTVTTFYNCKWDRSVIALDIESGDKVNIIGSWIKQGVLTADYSATIVNYGNSLVIDKTIFVPIAATGAETAWINNYNTVTCTNSRFGGETGSKTLINNFAVGESSFPISPNGIFLEDNEIYGVDGTGVARGSIRFFEIPNFVTFKDNFGFSDNVSMAFSSTVTGATIINAVGREFISIDVSGNFSGQNIYTGINEPANYILPEFFIAESRDAKIHEATASPTEISIGWNGWTFTNNAYNAANANHNLPAAVVGSEFTFFRNNTTFLIRAYPDGTETIGAGGAGKYLQIDTDKVYLTFKCFTAGHWDIILQGGAAWGVGYSYAP